MKTETIKAETTFGLDAKVYIFLKKIKPENLISLERDIMFLDKKNYLWVAKINYNE